MEFSKFFKRKVKQDKSCKNCKYYARDTSFDGYTSINADDSGHSYARCKHPNARYSYSSIERNTDWLAARMLGTCSRGGRRFKPNIEGLANILREK